MITLLLDRGAEKTPAALTQAVRSRCGPCVDLLMPLIDTRRLTGALTMAGTWGDIASMKTLLARGAAPAADLLLSMARSAATMPDDLVSVTVASGANVKVSTGMSGSVLDLPKCTATRLSSVR